MRKLAVLVVCAEFFALDLQAEHRGPLKVPAIYAWLNWRALKERISNSFWLSEFDKDVVVPKLLEDVFAQHVPVQVKQDMFRELNQEIERTKQRAVSYTAYRELHIMSYLMVSLFGLSLFKVNDRVFGYSFAIFVGSWTLFGSGLGCAMYQYAYYKYDACKRCMDSLDIIHTYLKKYNPQAAAGKE